MLPPAPLRLAVDLGAVAGNWRWFRDRAGPARCGAAVKADGYGLGARAVVAALAEAGCAEFCVATWAEAVTLWPLPAGARLSVLHGITADCGPAARAMPGVRPVLNTPAQVALWRETGGGACDVMLDTGMNRLGLSVDEAREAARTLAIDTLHSHLACADVPDHPLNARQLAAFQDAIAVIPARYYALANSDGVLLGREYRFDLVRPGIGLYGGIVASGLRGVVQPEALVLQTRDVPAGESVGYGATWTAKRPSRIAIVNLGYADGYTRALQHAGTALDGACPVAGRVSMDLTAFDITGHDAREGDWLPIDFDLAALSAGSGLSRYELLTGLGSRYERRYS